MLDNLNSDYNCANAGSDLHQLKQQLSTYREQGTTSLESQEVLNRIENQISFILNKCDIHHTSTEE